MSDGVKREWCLGWCEEGMVSVVGEESASIDQSACCEGVVSSLLHPLMYTCAILGVWPRFSLHSAHHILLFQCEVGWTVHNTIGGTLHG